MKTQIIRNQISKFMALAASVSLTIACPFSAEGAVFAKFDGIDGESQDAEHDKWIDVLSIDWGTNRPGGGATGQSRRRGSVVVEDMRLTIEYEKASPKLQEACLTGKIIPKLEIEQTATYGGSRQTYLKYELTNVMITSTRFRAEAGKGQGPDAEEPRPMEDYTLNFEAVKVVYTEYDQEGNNKGNVEYSWKVEEGAR